MAGQISVRKFRVLVEHLPPGNALEVARNAGWPASTWALWQVESRLRDLFALTYNANVPPERRIPEIAYLDRPRTEEEVALAAAQAAYDAQMEAELDALFARRPQQ